MEHYQICCNLCLKIYKPGGMNLKRKIMFVIIVVFNLLFIQLISATTISPKIIENSAKTNDTNPCDVVRDMHTQLATIVEGLKTDGYPILANLMAGILGFLALAVSICETIEGGMNMFRSSSVCPLCSI